jgi:hypothetical protein
MGVTPPVGTRRRKGIGPSTPRMNAGPSASDGKTFTASAPARCAERISVGVKAPRSTGTSIACPISTSAGMTTGETR